MTSRFRGSILTVSVNPEIAERGVRLSRRESNNILSRVISDRGSVISLAVVLLLLVFDSILGIRPLDREPLDVREELLTER
jgi:hypothetical protein